MTIFSIIITILYLLIIGSFAFGFDKVKLFKLENSPSKTKFSVIVPFRNEAKNLPNLIKTIQLLQYPKELFEVIFVDDASEDSSEKTIRDLLKGFDCVQLDTSIINNERKTNSPKRMLFLRPLNMPNTNGLSLPTPIAYYQIIGLRVLMNTFKKHERIVLRHQ